MDHGAVMQEANQDETTMAQADVGGRVRRRMQPVSGGIQRRRAIRERFFGARVVRRTARRIRESWIAPEGEV